MVSGEQVGAVNPAGERKGAVAASSGQICLDDGPEASRVSTENAGEPGAVGRAGQWDLDELSADPGDADGAIGAAEGSDTESAVREDSGGIGGVRAPSWLEEPGGRRGRWVDRVVPERFLGARLDPGRRGVLTLAVAGLVAVVATAGVVLWERPVARSVPVPAVRTATAVSARPSGAGSAPSAAPGAVPGTPESASTELVVSVVGLVWRVGLVRLPSGSRVADAITAAGGVQDGADLSGLNMAQRLQDGDQVLVGPHGPNAGPPQLGSTTINAGGHPSPNSAPAQRPGARINLNTATEAELDTLPGVGPVTARAIITWRTTNGRFTDITQLGDIDGIGPARLARLRDLVTV
ncbi:helix-hairpin-helix domain-containing protein [Nocardia sp. NPDC052566]|uniref:helix-hairpin-helix domain-containing protein n=1 Tax=Nocardia sp. NPDC052566 TaxID=3364330 RepID=UPI0037C7F954